MKRIAIVLALAAALSAPGLCHAFPLDQPAREALEAKLEREFSRYSTMGACVVFFENGEVTYTYCYGRRKLGGEAVTAESAFQVGSISKMIANIGLMQLVEQGKANLEDELGALLGFAVRSPYAPETPVTLRQLMTHTAALRDSAYYDEALKKEATPLQALFAGLQSQWVFLNGKEPGRQSEYSNFGGGLIGSLIEKLSGQTLDDYMAENVFAPLGITAAFQASLLWDDVPLCDIYHMPEKTLGKRLRDDETMILKPDFARDYILSAGKLIISAPDLAKLLMMLCDGGVYEDVRLLKESTVQEMRTPQNERGSVHCDSGRGLFMNILTNDQVEGRTMYGHGGKAYGMLCAAYFDPTDRTGAVMLTNGCRLNNVRNNVGMLGRTVMGYLYTALDSSEYRPQDAFLVE